MILQTPCSTQHSSDFCKKCDIKLTKADSLPNLDDICTYVVNDSLLPML